MAVDLLRLEVVGEAEATFGYKTVPAGDLVAWLCLEADLCIHCPGENDIQMHAATYHMDEGLQVADTNGNVFRLRIQAELVQADTGPRCDMALYHARMAVLNRDIQATPDQSS
jgi:hypothetical protein